MKIFDHETLKLDPVSVLTEIENFVGLPNEFRKKRLVQIDKNRQILHLNLPNGTHQCVLLNESFTEMPHIQPEKLKQLKDFFEPHRQKICEMLSYEMSWCRDSFLTCLWYIVRKICYWK